MSKITLSSVVDLTQPTTAATTINNNFSTIQTAFDNTLSRDGTQPDQMTANLDMNSNRILNLAAPVSGSEPARLSDLNAAMVGPITFNAVPTGGTQYQMLAKNSSSNYDDSWQSPPILGTTALNPGGTYTTVAGAITFSGNNIYSGTSTFNGASTFAAAATFNSSATFNGALTFSSSSFPSAKITGNGLLSGASVQPLIVGSGGGSGDDSGILITRTFTPSTGLLNSHAVRDESQLTVNVTGSQFSGYASFDSAYEVFGVATTAQNHIHGFQARQIWGASGHVSDWGGFTAQPSINAAAGQIDAAYGFHMLSPVVTAGSISNQYAFYSDPLSGATNNYFLYGSGASNPSILQGNLYVGGNLSQFAQEKVNIGYNGSTNQGLYLQDSYTSAATLNAVGFVRANVGVGTITTSLTATAYNTSSDERMKNFTGNYNPEEAIRIIKADPVRTFNWKETGDSAIGWGAQTSYAVDKDLATPGKTEEDTWGIDKGARTPYLWAAVSNILDRLEKLENAGR